MPVNFSKTTEKIRVFLDNIHLPMLDISLWNLLKIYIGGLFRNQVTKQAEGISWNFFISLFPFLLFLLSILPYFPHYQEVYDYIFHDIIPRVLPSNVRGDVMEYIEGIIMPKMEGISTLTIILVLFFSTSGTYSLINGFNENTDTQRGVVKEYVLSFFITLGFTIAIVLSILGIYYAEVVFKLLMPDYQSNWFASNLTKIISYVSFPLFYGLTLALVYWVGAVKIKRFGQAIPGAILTTILFMITTYVFAVYVRDIARYNVLYGSIGSFILLMIWVNVNVVLILIGNELNLAIKKIHTENQQKNSNIHRDIGA